MTISLQDFANKIANTPIVQTSRIQYEGTTKSRKLLDLINSFNSCPGSTSSCDWCNTLFNQIVTLNRTLVTKLDIKTENVSLDYDVKQRIEEEVAAINNSYDNFKLINAGVIEASTKDSITIDDCELGKYRISLAVNDYSVSIFNLENKFKRGSSAHPHVNNSHLCTGNGGSALIEACKNHYYADAFDIVNAILHTYNANDPYLKLQSWSSVCSICSNKSSSMYGYVCEACDDTFAACGNCDNNYCADCEGD